MGQLKILHSKIHNVKVTEANLNYVGSITIDSEVMEAAGLFPWQEVFIVNNCNGARFETYVIPGAKGSRKICLNGSAARQVQVGDEIIIMNYHLVDMSTKLTVIESILDAELNDVEYTRNIQASQYYMEQHHPKVVMLGDSGELITFVALGEDEDKFIKQ